MNLFLIYRSEIVLIWSRQWTFIFLFFRYCIDQVTSNRGSLLVLKNLLVRIVFTIHIVKYRHRLYCYFLCVDSLFLFRNWLYFHRSWFLQLTNICHRFINYYIIRNCVDIWISLLFQFLFLLFLRFVDQNNFDTLLWHKWLHWLLLVVRYLLHQPLYFFVCLICFIWFKMIQVVNLRFFSYLVINHMPQILLYIY